MTSHEARFEPRRVDPEGARAAADLAHPPATSFETSSATSSETSSTTSFEPASAGAVPGERGGSGGPGVPDGPDRGRSAFGALGAALRELVVVVAMALALSFVVKTWLVQAFYIPSGSMEDTLIVDDRVVVNKLVPDTVDLQRGDVVVFEDPADWLAPIPEVSQGPVRDGIARVLTFVGLLPNTSDDHLIKRVIGMPGDRVVCCDAEGRLTINGAPITEPYVKPGDVPSSMSFDITVPADRVWLMGDHRSDSEDSRYHDPDGNGEQGSVPIDRITGRAVAIVWPFERAGWLRRPEATFATVPPPAAASQSQSPSSSSTAPSPSLSSSSSSP